MLKSIHIKGFQNHTNKLIKLSKGVTTIHGLNDAGKTAVFRALYWVAMNRPIHGRYVNHVTGQATVVLTFKDCVVGRRKSRSKNLYRLDGRTFKAFGTGVPQAVRDALALDEVNFQKQFDLPFWFLNTTGELSAELNKIVNLSAIDVVNKRVAAKVRDFKTRHAILKEQNDKAIKTEKDLEWVIGFDVDLERLEKLATKQNREVEEGMALQKKIEKAKALQEELEEWRDLCVAADRLQALVVPYQRLAADINFLEVAIASAKHFKTQQAIKLPGLLGLRTLLEDFNLAEEGVRDLLHLVTKAITLKELLCQAENNLKRASKKLSEIQAGLPTCPTCGQEIQSKPS